jgi:hypothetical protein
MTEVEKAVSLSRARVSKMKRVGEKNEAFENLEQNVFKALENQKRRDVLRLIGAKKSISFTEVLNASKIADSPTLSYHLRELAPFIRQEGGKYELTPMGRDAYNLLLKTASYGKVVLFQKKRLGATFGNLLLWIIGIAAAAYLEVDITLTAIILPYLALVATGTAYQLFEEAK